MVIGPKNETISELRIKINEQNKEINELKEKIKLYSKHEAGEPQNVQIMSILAGTAKTTKDGRCLIAA